MAVKVVAKSSDLHEGASVKFRFAGAEREREGFVVRKGGRLFAYVNECRHIPMNLDWVENRFLSRDGCYIQCATHGALYEIDTGLCVGGPPEGKTLHALEVAESDGEIRVELPEDA